MPALTVRSEESDGIELMVTHNRQCGSGLNHGPDNLKDAALLGTTVNKVAEEDYPPALVPVTRAIQLIAKLYKQSFKLGSVAVNITNKIVHNELLARLKHHTQERENAKSNFLGTFSVPSSKNGLPV
jgi:hypothetical protein